MAGVSVLLLRVAIGAVLDRRSLAFAQSHVVGLNVEIAEEGQEDERVRADPVDEELGVLAVFDEQQLRRMDHDSNELDLNNDQAGLMITKNGGKRREKS